MKIQDYCKDAFITAEAHGFFDIYKKMKINYNNHVINQKEFIELEAIFKSNLINLICSELGESTQELRANNIGFFHEEIADTFIRLFTLCGFLNIDIEPLIIQKMKENDVRPYKHNRLF